MEFRQLTFRLSIPLFFLLLLSFFQSIRCADVYCYTGGGNSSSNGQTLGLQNVCLASSSCILTIKSDGTWQSGCLALNGSSQAVNTCAASGNYTNCLCNTNFCNTPNNNNFYAALNSTLNNIVKPTDPGNLTCFECGTPYVTMPNGTRAMAPFNVSCDGTKYCTGKYCVTRRSIQPRSYCATSWEDPKALACQKITTDPYDDQECICQQNFCNYPYDPMSAPNTTTMAPTTMPLVTTTAIVATTTKADNQSLPPPEYQCIRNCSASQVALTGGATATFFEAPTGCDKMYLDCTSASPYAAVTFGNQGSLIAFQPNYTSVRALLYCIRNNGTSVWTRFGTSQDPNAMIVPNQANCFASATNSTPSSTAAPTTPMATTTALVVTTAAATTTTAPPPTTTMPPATTTIAPPTTTAPATTVATTTMPPTTTTAQATTTTPHPQGAWQCVPGCSASQLTLSNENNALTSINSSLSESPAGCGKIMITCSNNNSTSGGVAGLMFGSGYRQGGLMAFEPNYSSVQALLYCLRNNGTGTGAWTRFGITSDPNAMITVTEAICTSFVPGIPPPTAATTGTGATSAPNTSPLMSTAMPATTPMPANVSSTLPSSAATTTAGPPIGPWQCVPGCTGSQVTLTQVNGTGPTSPGAFESPTGCAKMEVTCQSANPAAIIAFGTQGGLVAYRQNFTSVTALLYCIRSQNGSLVWTRFGTTRDPNAMFTVTEAHCEVTVQLPWTTTTPMPTTTPISTTSTPTTTRPPSTAAATTIATTMAATSPTSVNNSMPPGPWQCVTGCSASQVTLTPDSTGKTSILSSGTFQAPETCSKMLVNCTSTTPAAYVQFGTQGGLVAFQPNFTSVQALLYCIRNNGSLVWTRFGTTIDPNSMLTVTEAHCNVTSFPTTTPLPTTPAPTTQAPAATATTVASTQAPTTQPPTTTTTMTTTTTATTTRPPSTAPPATAPPATSPPPTTLPPTTPAPTTATTTLTTTTATTTRPPTTAPPVTAPPTTLPPTTLPPTTLPPTTPAPATQPPTTATTPAPQANPNSSTIICPDGRKFGPNDLAVKMGEVLKNAILGGMPNANGLSAVQNYKDGIQTHICNYMSGPGQNGRK